MDAIFRCGDRASSQCPFVEEQPPRRPSIFGEERPLMLPPLWGTVIVGAMVAVALCFTVAAVAKHIQVAWWAAGATLIVGAGVVLGIRQEQLVHSTSGAQLKRIRLWGRELRRQFITAPEPVPLDLPLDEPLHYPPSVAALATQDAASVVRAAVLGLLTAGKIQALMVHIHRLGPDGASERSRSRYTYRQFRPPGDDRIPRGWLEKSLYAKFAEGLPLEGAIYDIFDKDKSDPGQWLLKRVQERAVARGWGRQESRKGLPFLKRFDLDPEHTESLAQERAITEQLSRALAEARPALSTALDEAIRTGIASRRQSDC